MHLASGQIPDKPSVDVSEKKLAFFGQSSCFGNIIQNPLYLGSRKISVYYQAGFFSDRIGEAFFFKSIADIGGSAALPNYGIINGTACLFVPDNGCFPLVGNSDCSNLLGGNSASFQNFAGYTALLSPYFHSIMLDPALLRKNLRKLLLGSCNFFSVFIEQDCPAARSSLIKG